MMIQTKEGNLLNLAHAFGMDYDATKQELCVWWAVVLPPSGDRDPDGHAGLYDMERLTRHHVLQAEWERFMRATLSVG